MELLRFLEFKFWMKLIKADADMVVSANLLWGGFNLEYGKLENSKLKNYFVSKNGKTASPKDYNSKLEFNLENGYLENGVGN